MPNTDNATPTTVLSVAEPGSGHAQTPRTDAELIAVENDETGEVVECVEASFARTKPDIFAATYEPVAPTAKGE